MICDKETVQLQQALLEWNDATRNRAHVRGLQL